MPVSDLFLHVLSPRPLTDPGDGAAILELFDQWAPEWAPGRWGFGEPSEPAEPPDRPQMTAVWDDGIMWYGTGKGEPLGSFFAASHRRRFSDLAVSSPPGLVDGERAAGLLRALAVRTEAAYGFAHRLVPGDLATTEPRSASITDLGPSMHTGGPALAQSGLPNVWWANVLGPPVVELLGAERIATAPAHLVEQLGDDLWYLQLTGSILDNDTDPARFEAARAAVKQHLGPDAFYDKSKGRAGPYRTIRLPEPLPRPSATPPVQSAHKVDGYGPPGFTQNPGVREHWQPWSRQVEPGVWELADMPADALTALVEALPPENRKAQVDEIPTLDAFAGIAAAVPLARFSGRVIAAGAGTEGVTVERLQVPAGTDEPSLETIASTAEDDTRAGGDRTLRWH